MEKRRFHLTFIILILFPIISFAQATNKTFQSTDVPNVFKNEAGATIEYLGMQNWKAKEIQDSLRNLAPNRPVSACMAVLKKNLGFDDAMVMGYFNQNTGSMYTVVTVLEDENRLKPIQLPEKEKPTIDEWTGKQDLSKQINQNLLSNGLQFFSKDNDDLSIDTARIKQLSFYSDEDAKFLTEFYNHIKNQDTEKDRELAHNTIKDDSNILNRILASIVLLNFENTDDEIYTMLEQMRSENSQISRFSATVLSIMTQNKSNIDWSGAIKSIRALLAGTNLHNFRTTINSLTNTNISSSLAGKILTDNTFLLQERLQAKHDETRQETFNFVNQISPDELSDTNEAFNWLSQF